MRNKLTKRAFKEIRKANRKYKLINDGDKIAVGMSGGKDSSILLYFLHLLKKYTPISFNLVPIYVDLGWDNDIAPIKKFAKQLGFSLHTEATDIGQIVFDIRQEKNPCSLCANLRRGALNNTAKRLGCNKLALGHHLDDVVNTWLMSILYENRYNVFKPKTYLDRIDLTVIRPMIYVQEADILEMTDVLKIASVKNKCPADGFTKRDEISNLVELIEREHPGAKKKIIYSIENVNLESFWYK